jgi:outer membrane protein assembly factor BamA
VPEAEAQFGYGWESERLNIEADFAQPLLAERQIALGLHFTDGTAYQNAAEIGIGENTLSALFLKHDWIDYYAMQGIEPYLRFRLPSHTTLRLSYANEDYESLETQTDWSFFSAGADEFRPNPPLTLLADATPRSGDGRLEAARFEIVRDSRRARQVGTIGFFGQALLELGRGDFDFNRWLVDARSYMRLGTPAHLALRLATGGRFGHDRIPSQKHFYVGGLGTVRGHAFFAQSGDRKWLGNIEYTFVIDRLEHGILMFYDAGTAWNSLTHDFDASVVLQAMGFGFKSLDDDFQANVAWPVGAIGGDVEVTVRLNRTF